MLPTPRTTVIAAASLLGWSALVLASLALSPQVASASRRAAEARAPSPLGAKPVRSPNRHEVRHASRKAPRSHEARQEAPQDVGELIRALDSSDAHERAMAACRLEKRVASEVRPAMSRLLEMLGDGTPVEPRLCREWGNWHDGHEEPSSPGREAAVALEKLGSEAVDPLIAVLGDPSAVARENAALALGLIEDARAIDPLARSLSDDGVAAVRARAAWAIGMIEDARGIGALSSALRADGDPEVREQSAWGLGMIESEAGVPALAVGIRDGAADVREQAAWALGMIEDARGVDPLVGALDDPDADVREQAAWGLGMIESVDAAPALVAALKDGDPNVREQAAWALGMTEAVSAAGALAEALEDEDADVRKQAIWALGRLMQSGDVDIDMHDLAERLRRTLRQRRDPP